MNDGLVCQQFKWLTFFLCVSVASSQPWSPNKEVWTIRLFAWTASRSFPMVHVSNITMSTICTDGLTRNPLMSELYFLLFESLKLFRGCRWKFDFVLTLCVSALLDATGKRGIVVTRSTYPTSGQWAGHWLGDNYSAWDQLLKSIVGMCVDMPFSYNGFHYGFRHNPNPNHFCLKYVKITDNRSTLHFIIFNPAIMDKPNCWVIN